MDRLIEKLDKTDATVYEDGRGWVRSFNRFSAKDLHLASMRPGAVRGNHSHHLSEVISVIDGGGICEIEVKDEASGKTEVIRVEDNEETYRISAGIKHTVRNLGDSIIYLVCFYIDI